MPQSIIPDNQTKSALAAGGTVIGTMLAELRQPAVMQLLINAGFDFVIIDNEHGPFSIESISELSRTARILGLTPIVRVPDLAYPYLAQSLDAGAQGIMLPRVTDAEQVRAALAMIKYPPVGRRGCAFNRGHTDFRPGDLAENTARANAQTMLVVQVETRAAMDNLDEIVSLPGVDAAFVGPTDLSIALDVPGQSNSETLVNAIERVIDTCARHGVHAAIQANDMHYAQYWLQRGMKMISYSSETSLLVGAGAAAVNTLRAEG